MAIYERFTASNGVRIALDDACFAGKTPAELRAAYNELNRVAREICVKAAQRMAQEKQTKGECTNEGLDAGAGRRGG